MTSEPRRTGRRPAVDTQAREVAILDAARALAERDGWAAVTTRRLAEAIGFSQPVIYWHFADGLPAVRTAVALAGFDELAERIEKSPKSPAPRADLEIVIDEYFSFAAAHPATYRAMFEMPIHERFATPGANESLRRCFEAIRTRVGRVAGADDETATELIWASVHGLVSLERDGRLRPAAHEARIAALLASHDADPDDARP